MSVTITYYYVKCPHCGKVFSRTITAPEPKHFGQTIVSCKKCKRTFVNSEAYEWENLKDIEKKNYLMTEEIYPEASMTFGLKRYTRKALEFKYNPSMLKKKEIVQSLARTSNPEYRRELEENGRIFYGKDIKDDSLVTNISLQDTRVIKVLKNLLESGGTLPASAQGYYEKLLEVYSVDE